MSSGGGGYGDPLAREPQEVLEDVLDNFVSVESARRDYGVVLVVGNPDLLEFVVDQEATDNLRAEIRSNQAKTSEK